MEINPNVNLLEWFSSFSHDNRSKSCSKFPSNFEFETSCLKAVPDLRCVQYMTQDVLIRWGELQLESSSNRNANRAERVKNLAISIFSHLSHLHEDKMFEDGDSLENLIAETDTWLRTPLHNCLTQYLSLSPTSKAKMTTRQQSAFLPSAQLTADTTPSQPSTDIAAATNSNRRKHPCKQQASFRAPKPNRKDNIVPFRPITNSSKTVNNGNNSLHTLSQQPIGGQFSPLPALTTEYTAPFNVYNSSPLLQQPTVSSPQRSNNNSPTPAATGLSLLQLECLLVLANKHNYFASPANQTSNNQVILTQMLLDPQFMGVFHNFNCADTHFTSKLRNILHIVKFDFYTKHGHNLLGITNHINNWFNLQHDTTFPTDTTNMPVFTPSDSHSTNADKMGHYLRSNGVQLSILEWCQHFPSPFTRMSAIIPFLRHLQLPMFVDNNGNECLFNDTGSNLMSLLNYPQLVKSIGALPNAFERERFCLFLCHNDSDPIRSETVCNSLIGLHNKHSIRLVSTESITRNNSNNSNVNNFPPLVPTNSSTDNYSITNTRNSNNTNSIFSTTNLSPQQTQQHTTTSAITQSYSATPTTNKSLIISFSLPNNVTVAAYVLNTNGVTSKPLLVDITSAGSVEFIEQPFISSATSKCAIGRKQLLATVTLPNNTGVLVYVNTHNSNNSNADDDPPPLNIKLDNHGEIIVHRPTHTISLRYEHNNNTTNGTPN